MIISISNHLWRIRVVFSTFTSFLKLWGCGVPGNERSFRHLWMYRQLQWEFWCTNTHWANTNICWINLFRMCRTRDCLLFIWMIPTTWSVTISGQMMRLSWLAGWLVIRKYLVAQCWNGWQFLALLSYPYNAKVAGSVIWYDADATHFLFESKSPAWLCLIHSAH